MKKTATIALAVALSVGVAGNAFAATSAKPSHKAAVKHTTTKAGSLKTIKVKSLKKKFNAAKVAEETNEAKTGKSAQ